MSDLPDFVPDKDELKSKLPLAYVCGHLGIALDRQLQAVCPFHAGGQEKHPSFYLWEGDDGKQRWHCQVCATGGDIFDLIQKKEGVTYGDALERAQYLYAQLPPGYEPPQIRMAPRKTPDDWKDEVDAARAKALEPELQGYMSMMVGFVGHDDLLEARAWDNYLRTTWGWGIGEQGEIYIPHFTESGILTGCKIRKRNGDKTSLEGSVYQALYGSWLGRRYREVLITEGETDAVWAAWAASEARVPIDVFAMPSGAQHFDISWMTFLAKANVVFLALDPDEHGVKASYRWIEALNTAGFRDVRVCVLPLGRDLRDAKPDFKKLLANARKPIAPPTAIQRTPGGYAKQDSKGNMIPITNWWVEPVARLTATIADENADPGYDIIIHHRGTYRSGVVKLSDLKNIGRLRDWCARYEMIFTGTEGDAQKISEIIEFSGSIVPEIFQTERVGLHYPPEDYADLGPTIVYPESYDGKLPWRYAPGRQAMDVSGRVYLPLTTKDRTINWRWLKAFLALSDPSVTHPILAWVVASARRPEASEFPLLFIGGSSGVGKSTLARLACRLAGSGIELDLGATTQFPLMKTMACSTSLPVFIDEWTRLSRDDTRRAFQGYVPSLYAGMLAERGQSDLSSMVYRLTSPVIIAGEDTFTLDREKDRIVAVRPTRDFQNVKALAYIAEAPLERIGSSWHHWLANERPDGLPPINEPAFDRPTHNREVLEAGWATLRQFLQWSEAQGEPNVPEIPDVPNLTVFDYRSPEADENAYEVALREGLSIADQNGLPVVWSDPAGRGTWVRTKVLIGLLKTRNVDIELPGGSRAMLDYFRERYGDARPDRQTPPNCHQSVHANLIKGMHLEPTPEPDSYPPPTQET